MAVRYAIANGNWSSVSTWDGAASIPTSADDVYLDNKNVTLDVDATVLNLYMTARSGGTAGGTLTTTTTRSFTCNTIYPYSVNTTIYHNGASNTTLTINANLAGATFQTGTPGGVLNLNTGNIIFNGNVTGGTSGVWCAAVYLTGTGLFTLTGNLTSSGYLVFNIVGTSSKAVINGIITGGTSSMSLNNASNLSNALTLNGTVTSAATNAIVNASTGTITINGTQTAIGTALVYAIANNSTGVITINGDCLGALSATPSNAYIVNNNSTGVLNINGNVTARSVSPSTTIGMITNNSTGTINVTGNITGGSVANAFPISLNANGTINVTGNITGGSHVTNTPAIYIYNTIATANITGATASNVYPAIFSTVTTAIFNLLGNIVNTAGLVAYYGSLNIKCSPTAGQSITYRSTSGTDRVLATTNVSNGAPVIANVRNGIVYGSTNELTGTLKIALPVDVRVNVPTDNTVGTATITAQDFWDYAVSNLTTNNSIGRRLKNVATVNTTGAQLSAFSS